MENVLIITSQELISLIRDAVKSEMKGFHPEHDKSGTDDDFISIEEVCKILKVSKPTVFAMRKKGTLPFHRVRGTRTVRYRRSEVLDALKCVKQNNFKN